MKTMSVGVRRAPFMKLVNLSLLFLLSTLLAACGGGNSDSGILIEGKLTEGEGTVHKQLNMKHSAGDRIEEVKICALGSCSTTDGMGQWGFTTPGSFKGGEVLFSIDGHGINTTTVVSIPMGADEVFIHFEHNAGMVKVHHMDVDGKRMDDHDEAGHAH